MKTIIAGSRSIKSESIVFDAIKQAQIKENFEITEVVSGTADGVDELGEKWGAENDIDIVKFPYEDYLDDNSPKVAPLVRNKKMAEYSDQAIIVWDGESNGTKDMIKKAKQEDLDIYIKRTDTRQLTDF